MRRRSPAEQAKRRGSHNLSRGGESSAEGGVAFDVSRGLHERGHSFMEQPVLRRRFLAVVALLSVVQSPRLPGLRSRSCLRRRSGWRRPHRSANHPGAFSIARACRRKDRGLRWPEVQDRPRLAPRRKRPPPGGRSRSALVKRRSCARERQDASNNIRNCGSINRVSAPALAISPESRYCFVSAKVSPARAACRRTCRYSCRRRS